ncbi:MAG: nitrate- and nitrite sensing domain-containing protein [Aliarcobacter sp.]
MENLNNSLKKLQDLNTTRNGVDALSINASIAIGYYTDTNTSLLNTIGTITKLSNSSKVSQERILYELFIIKKPE